jgi:L-alanine-DL-glutamate epimerase-like enolase superfamily enzyme
MLQLRAYPSSLPFEYPFRISKGIKTEQPALLVSLGFGRLIGWGEAPAISYYPETVDSMMASLEKGRSVIERYALHDPERFWHFLHHLFEGQNFLVAALDIASWDLFAQLRRQPLFAAMGFADPGSRANDYTIGIDTAEEMVRKMKSRPSEIYKIKLAKPDDIDLLRALRVASRATFRVDVNEGWSFDDCKRLLPELKNLGVELLEQPLPKNAWDEMKELKQISPIPLIADEACVEEKDLNRCAESFHGVNIKLTKCAGITPARRMLKRAPELGLKTMLGSMNESTIGTSALVHLSAAADWLDADGPLLLNGDYAEGLNYSDENSVSLTPGRVGLGIQTTFRKQ